MRFESEGRTCAPKHQVVKRFTEHEGSVLNAFLSALAQNVFTRTGKGKH